MELEILKGDSNYVQHSDIASKEKIFSFGVNKIHWGLLKMKPSAYLNARKVYLHCDRKITTRFKKSSNLILLAFLKKRRVFFLKI